MIRKSMRLWRIVGTAKRGGNCTVKVRASTYVRALAKAAEYGCVNVDSCVLIEEAS